MWLGERASARISARILLMSWMRPSGLSPEHANPWQQLALMLAAQSCARSLTGRLCLPVNHCLGLLVYVEEFVIRRLGMRSVPPGEHVCQQLGSMIVQWQSFSGLDDVVFCA